MTLWYHLHGLTFSSEIAIPATESSLRHADVCIRLGDVPDRLAQPAATGVLFDAARDEYLLRVSGVATYWARLGREIVVCRHPGATDAEVCAFLLGHAVSAVLHQRGLLVLHASGVVGAHGAVLIAGHSGRGKSTIAAALSAQGFPLLTDDVAVPTIDAGGRAVVHPGVPQVRLWSDAARRLGLEPERMTPVRAGIEKYAVPVPGSAPATSHPLRHLFVLEWASGDSVEATPVHHSAAFSEIRRHTRILRAMEGLGLHATHFQQAANMADRVPVTRIGRPRGGQSVAQVLATILPSLA